jgi:preprotein translocase subunit YajC
VKFTAIIAQQDGAAGQPAPGNGDQQKAAPPGGMGGFLTSPLFLPVMIGLFFLVVILPGMRRQKREAAAKLAAMRPGAKVITNGGIVGRIVSMKDGEDEIVIKSDDTKLRILKSHVGTVIGDDAPAPATADQKG